ncbi:MAG TPA: adenylyl-sulfate kinase [Acidimicrobiales bacterium]|nr:adenylyl-sulfate kinase [Acidimicrobiales bacterium]
MTPGATVWLTGLSGAGKSTVAGALDGLLGARGARSYLLDGDDLREGLNADLGFSAEDRAENVRRVGEVALLFARAGYVALVSVISPFAVGRDRVRARHEAHGVPFLEIHVATPLEVCEARDPKGLYARARAGEIERFTGVSDPYEAPVAPELVLSTDGHRPEDSAAEVLALLGALAGLDAVGAAADPGRA